jgi:cysteine synthase A
MRIKQNQQQHVGNTPFGQLKRVVSSHHAAIWAKCEFSNPTGTPKDRMYTYMIDRLEQLEDIRPGMTLVDASTGNGGGALARAAHLKGYRSVIVMPAGMTEERKTIINSWHGEIIETSPDAFLAGAESVALQYAAEHSDSYYLNQAATPLNSQAMRSIGQEIVTACQQLHLKPDVFVCSIGTGGTYTGVATELHAAFRDILKIGIEVDQSAPLHAKRKGRFFEHHSHNLMGLGPGKIGGNLDEQLVDEVVTVAGDDSWKMMKRLVKEEGLETGPTSGANVLVAQEYARQVGPSGMVVTVLFDAAWKYLSIWDGRYELYEHDDDVVISGK